MTTYKEIFALDPLWRSFAVSVYLCVVGTIVFFALTSTLAYALSRPMMPMRKQVLIGILITIVFTSPLIPTYLLIRNLGTAGGVIGITVPSTPEQLKAGIVLVATVPILFVYPFIQKYFVKGTMLGSLIE